MNDPRAGDAVVRPALKYGILATFAAVMLAGGALRAWHAPLAYDEQHFYLPAIRAAAQQMPAMTLDYELPSPPLMLIVQAAVWRTTGSVALLRLLATLALIGAVFIAARIAAPVTRTALLLVLMVGTFPPVLLNAFSLKQHAFTLLFLLAALLSWKRERPALMALFLACGMLTNQLAAALGITLGLIALHRRQWVALSAIVCSALPLGLLVIRWRGAQPPAFGRAFPEVPTTPFNPAQLLLMLVMLGFWIAPLVAGVRAWWVWLLATPMCAALLHFSGIVRPGGSNIYVTIVGPVMNTIRAVMHSYGATLAVAALLAAAGFLFFTETVSLEGRLYAAVCALLLLRVPYFFESYYALVICVLWPLISDSIRPRRELIQCLYIGCGVAYATVKVMTASG